MSWVWKPFGTTDAAHKCFVCRRCCIQVDTRSLIYGYSASSWLHILIYRHGSTYIWYETFLHSSYIPIYLYYPHMIIDVIISSLLVAQQIYSFFFDRDPWLTATDPSVSLRVRVGPPSVRYSVAPKTCRATAERSQPSASLRSRL